LIKIATKPPGAVVQLDGRLLCQTTPCSKLEAESPHEFLSQKEGTKTSRKSCRRRRASW
jgi:hypothetical protein